MLQFGTQREGVQRGLVQTVDVGVYIAYSKTCLACGLFLVGISNFYTAEI